MLIRSAHISVERWRDASRQAALAARQLSRAQIAHCRGAGPAATAEMVEAVRELQRVEHDLFREAFEELDRASIAACQEARGRGVFHGQHEPPDDPREPGGTG